MNSPFNFNKHSIAVLAELLSCYSSYACSYRDVNTRSSPALRQSTQAFRSSVQQTLPGKEKESFFSDLSVFQ